MHVSYMLHNPPPPPPPHTNLSRKQLLVAALPAHTCGELWRACGSSASEQTFHLVKRRGKTGLSPSTQIVRGSPDAKSQSQLRDVVRISHKLMPNLREIVLERPASGRLGCLARSKQTKVATCSDPSLEWSVAPPPHPPPPRIIP